jgi:hypothetical protein
MKPLPDDHPMMAAVAILTLKKHIILATLPLIL